MTIYAVVSCDDLARESPGRCVSCVLCRDDADNTGEWKR